MVSTCIVPECKDSKRKRLAGVRYHRFRVSCPSLCRRWLKAANNPKYGVNTAMAALKNLRVCSLHFRPEDYERNVLDQSVKSLKESAVPSINLGEGGPGPPVKPARTGTRLIPGMCSVLGCGSSRRGAQRFKLPKDPEKRLEWVQFVFEVNGQRLKESSWTDITICREHFTEGCFGKTKTGAVQLRSGAVPSLRGRSEPGEHVESPRSVETREVSSSSEKSKHTSTDVVTKELGPEEQNVSNTDLNKDKAAAVQTKKYHAMPTDDIPSSADAFAIITLSAEESDSSDEGEVGDEGGVNSDSEWNPLDEMLLDEALLQDSEEETEDEDEEDKDSPGGLKINELCNECGRFFNSLKPHTCEHKIKPFSCNICGKRCVSEAALKIHSRVHSETYEIPCKYCHVTFKRKVDKLKHEQIHEDRNDPYKCPDCPKIFPTSKARRIHLSYHRTSKDFKCGVCGFEFRDLHHLRRHSVVHTGLKPYKCSVCERGFNQASNLKSHMRVHTGEKPYKCPHCDKSFNHNVSLKSHVQRCHSSRSGHEHKMGKINEKASSASDAEDNESGTGSESDNADKQDRGETVQKETTDLPKRRSRTGRSRGRPKSNRDGTSVLSGQNEDQCSNAKTSKSKLKKLKKSGANDEELELEQSDSDISFNSEEEEEQKARRSTRTSRRRPTKDDDGDFHPEEENEKKTSIKNRGGRRKKVVV